MADSWQEYQEEVATFFRSLGLEAMTNLTVQGVRTTHDIDVFVKSHHVGFVVVWIIECKHVDRMSPGPLTKYSRRFRRNILKSYDSHLRLKQNG